MAGIGGYNGWRWIFIIEGLATFVFAIVSKFFIVDWPETAKFLSPEERQLLIRRLSEDVAEARMDRLNKKARRRAFGDWKIYVGYVFHLLPSHPFHVHASSRLIKSQHFDVSRCQQHWLQHLLLHPNNPQSVGLDCCPCTSPFDPDLHCRRSGMSRLGPLD